MKITARALICFLPALCLCALLLFARTDSKAQQTQQSDIPPAAVRQDDASLFPGVTAQDVTAVYIKTPQTVFDLRREKDASVSINGRHGDRDVFATLLEHIAGMAFIPTDPFAAQGTPLLTLVISHQGAEHTAAFYTDEGEEEYARIIAGTTEAPRYGKTDGWRIGTLLLACEGTRVQDESGREIPVE